ncbi:MAG TPA: hypothetical protein VJB11_02540 [archaeon]|nr:hypothetical protein [archaeon]
MIRKLYKMLEIIRDVNLLIFSAVIMYTGYEKLGIESTSSLLFAIAAALFVFSLTSIMLLFARIVSMKYFYANAIIQLALSIILSLFILLAGIVIFILNIAIIIALKKARHKK